MKKIVLSLAAILGLTATILAQNSPFCPSDTFVSITSLPISSNDAAVVGSKIYTIYAGSPINGIIEYDVSTGLKTIITNTPNSIGETTTTYYNNRLYFFGGYTNSPSNIAKSYDISTNSWSDLPNIPVAVTQTSAVTLNGSIYIIGSTLGSVTQYFWRFDPTTNTYTTLASPNPMLRNSKIIVYSDNVYCLGGHNNSDVSNNFSVYNATTNQWANMPPMPFPRTKVAAAVRSNYLYVFGGATYPLFTTQLKYFAFNFLTNSWVVADGTIPATGFTSAAVTVNDTIFLPNNNFSYKYFCSPTCFGNTSISTQNNQAAIGSNVALSATTSDPNPSFAWQSDFGQGFQTLKNYGKYSGVNTNTLSISNMQLSEHQQPIRVISTSGNCIDTSNVAILSITDTCVNTITDTAHISVTDTLVINTITGFAPPNQINTIRVFPNPANDHITIHYGNFTSMTGYQLKIENSLGQQVFQTSISQQSNYLSLNNWGGNGLYFVKIINPQGNTIDIRKIVIQ